MLRTKTKERIIPILTALDPAKIKRFEPYLLDQDLEVEKKFGNTQLKISGYKMEDFKADNEQVMAWFATLQQQFHEWRKQQYPNLNIAPVNLVATGSRSFNASYTESDLECAIVSENFDDFKDFCRFLHSKYNNGHNFTALKTAAGLPLLIIKGETGFCCPELSKLYPGKTLPQLEVTFRHPNVHKIIQDAGAKFFAARSSQELESYVFNKRRIELIQRAATKDAMFDEKPLKSVLEEFKGALSAALKCLPSGSLQETPAFNKEEFAKITKPKTPLSDSIALGITLHVSQREDGNKPQSVVPIPKY